MTVDRLDFVHRYVPPSGLGAAAGGVTLLMLHGTGGDEQDLLGLGKALVPAAGLLSPRGKVLEHGMPRYFRRLAEGVFDEQDVRDRAHELADFIAVAASRYAFDPAKVIAVGYSNGANIAAAVLLLRPAALAGAVLLRPMVPLRPDGARGETPDLSGKPVFIAAGRADPMVAASQTEALAQLLRSAGAEVTIVADAQGHGLEPGDVGLARSWLENMPERMK